MTPLFITQLNCQESFGLSPRRFRELIRSLRLPVVKLGKLRGVEATHLLEALRAHAIKPEHEETNRDRLRRIAGLAHDHDYHVEQANHFCDRCGCPWGQRFKRKCKVRE